MNRYRIYDWVRVLATAAVFSALGTLALLARAYATELFDVLLIVMGFGAVAVALPLLWVSVSALCKHSRSAPVALVLALAQIVLGVLFVFLPRDAAPMPYLLVLYALVLPIACLVVARNQRQLRFELPKCLLGGFLFAVLITEAERLMCAIFGWALIGLAVLYLIVSAIRLRKSKV